MKKKLFSHLYIVNSLIDLIFNFRSEFDEIIVKASINGKEVSRERVVKDRKRNNQIEVI